jgi:DNA mismatch repair protein MutL
VIANPLINRSAKSYMTLIANGRVIKNPRLIAALTEAFDQRIPKGRYPIALVKIECDPLLMDVNIHPTKQEIKFSEDAKLAALLVEIVHKSINRFAMIQESDHGTFAKETDRSTQEGVFVSASFPLEEQDSALVVAEPDPLPFQTEAFSPVPMEKMSRERKDILPEMAYIGQYSGTYLLFQNAEGLFLVDQHAAAERIRYERYAQKMSDPNPQYYDLLIPFNIDFSNHEAIQIQKRLAEISAFGITLTPSGTQSFFINSVPAWFPHGFEELYAEEVIRLAVEGKNPTAIDVRDELAKLLACKHSIKANHYINEGEVKTLMHDLKQCKNPYTCPHGRPVVVRLPLYDIEKWFKRVM